MNNSYYDGPVKDRGLPEEKLEEEIKKEQELSDSLDSWEEL